MTRGLQGLLLALAGATLLTGGAGAGSYFPPPGDGRPVWSPDASVIVYASLRDPRGLHVIRPDGSDDHPLPGFNAYMSFAFSPDWFWIAFNDNDPVTLSQTALYVSRPDSTGRRLLSDSDGGRPSWSPDGTRLAFTRNLDGSSPPDVHTIRVDGSERRLIAANAFEPRWSPDGSRIAYIAVVGPARDRWDIAVARTDGAGQVNLTANLEGNVFSYPAWSRDGARLAFVGRGFIGVIRADGTGLRRYRPIGLPGALDWSPDGRRLLYSGEGPMLPPGGTGVFVLDLTSGLQTLLAPFGTNAAWSPDGSEVVFSGGGECKDRSGVYRVDVGTGRRVRVTNDCRLRGTASADVLRGTDLADILLGLGGDDRLAASDGNYMGDDLYGGTGNDVLTGDFLGDVLSGEGGRDRLDGGPGPDTLRGGPGADLLDGAGGRDTIVADDGEPDRVVCGTNSPSGGRELDAAFVDPRDRVGTDCELLYRDGKIDLRRGRTNFRIDLWDGNPGRLVSRRTLRCSPPGGTLSHPAAACRALATMRGALAPVPTGTLCPAPLPSFRHARLEGTVGGVALLVSFNRYNACETARWNRHRFLLEGR